MTNTSLKLVKKLPPEHVTILADVFTAGKQLEIEMFIVGATARDIIFEHVHSINIKRATNDIDLGISVNSWKEYAKLKLTLIKEHNFTQDTKQEQRLWKDDSKIDLIPFGSVEEVENQIAFPLDRGAVMSTLGFREAYNSSIRVTIETELEVGIASIPGLVLLKFVSFHDRPHERKRDAEDIWYIVLNYLEIDPDLLYQSHLDLIDDNFDYDVAGARVLGRDVGKLITKQIKEIIELVLTQGTREFDLFVAAALNGNSTFKSEKEDRMVEILTGLKEGISESHATPES